MVDTGKSRNGRSNNCTVEYKKFPQFSRFQWHWRVPDTFEADRTLLPYRESAKLEHNISDSPLAGRSNYVMDSNSEDPARRKELLRKWRTVLALNILVSAINGKGHPNFRWEASKQPEKEPRQHSLLKYLVAILVRNNDIVAAVAHKPNAFTNAQSGGIHVNIMGTVAAPLQLSGLASGTVQNDRGMPPPTSFIAVANPHSAKSPLGAEHHPRRSPEQDPYFAGKSPDIDCLVVAGESHLFNDDYTATWRNILKIR
ncbi:hypothetical protein PILCRDRAFT_736126 [Piloderma croceum F 1598]|uniref:Uncharacterized protein n=1 Tax=Piloderma croceum (strain F 1598) TaxID=765440 RepID=A0A0C3EY61_PILCF|nr:hypothetical protein PILCRDRAFT_736126 [Piloderma croceum F 1598]